MFENSSEELASHKLLILYILDKINMDLTNSQITQVVLETEMMNYFSLQQFLSQLMESKFLTTYKESDREYYSLTQKGLEILEYFLLFFLTHHQYLIFPLQEIQFVRLSFFY